MQKSSPNSCLAGSMENDIIQFHNCLILRDRVITKEDLWTRAGKIVDPEPIFFDQKNYADLKIDCQGLLIAPGFIDVQVNGTTKYLITLNCVDRSS